MSKIQRRDVDDLDGNPSKAFKFRHGSIVMN